MSEKRVDGTMAAFVVITSVAGLSCCGHLAPPHESAVGVEVAPLVRTITAQLEKLNQESIDQGRAALLQTDEVEIELSFDVKRTAEGEAGIKLEVVSLDAKASEERNRGQKLTIKFKRTEARTVQVPPNPAAFEHQEGMQ